MILISFTLAWGEYIISFITILLPDVIIDLFTLSVTKIYNLFNITLSQTEREFKYLHKTERMEVDGEHYSRMRQLINAASISDLAAVYGYGIESHVVRTKDDYLLTIHRLMKPGIPRNGKVVYFHHGLLMSSEIWLTMLDKSDNLPFVLYDLGYDVWLGNNRGNKYCQKHVFKLRPEQFWNFSIDEFALFDIPNIIDYILEYTEQSFLTYIGFSQGTAQAFASVSINNDLNKKIDKLIAISPATTPHGLYSKFLDMFIKASPNIIYLLFSRKVLMPSVAFWQTIMYPPLFNTSIDLANYTLFNWKAYNILRMQKLCLYAHLYLTTSVKTVVHWFQIMQTKNFQMYTESSLHPMSYPLKNIKVPVHLIYGDTDSLVDINLMKDQLPNQNVSAIAVEGHEHLDNLWGIDVHEKVFKHVLDIINDPQSQPQSNGTKS